MEITPQKSIYIYAFLTTLSSVLCGGPGKSHTLVLQVSSGLYHFLSHRLQLLLNHSGAFLCGLSLTDSESDSSMTGRPLKDKSIF